MPRSAIPRALALAALLAGLLCGALSAGAMARDTPMARFLVSFEGERTVAWDEPRWSPSYDCQHIYWTESTGSERWQVKSKPRKALLWLTSYGDVNIEVGSWDPQEITEEYAFEGNGFIERSRTDRSGFYANDRCGPATSQTDPPRPDDCGNRLPRQRIVANIRRGVVDVDVTEVQDRNTPPPFRECWLIFPPDVPVDWPEQITGRLAVRDIFNPRKPRLTVAASRSWSHVSELFGGKGRRTERAGVRWKLTLERVLDRRAPGRRGPSRRRARR